MHMEKEIEMLIARYKTDVAALEEREEDLTRQTDIIENMIPNVLVTYMEKLPQQEVEAEVTEKLEHLKNVLKELQVVIGLVKEEKYVMKKRIEELEIFLANRSGKNFDQTINTDSPEPMSKNQGRADIKFDKPEVKRSVNIKTEETESQRKIFEEDDDAESNKVESDEPTDWEKVAKDLQKQVKDLTASLNNSSKKLLESKDYIKNLEEKYSKLKKELDSQKQTGPKKQESKIKNENLGEKLSQAKSEKANPSVSFSDARPKITESERLVPDLKHRKPGKSDSKLKRIEDNEAPQQKTNRTGLDDAKQEKRNNDLQTTDQLMKFEELLKNEDTDWKQVYEDLQKQVLELTENVNDSVQKLSRSKSYVRHLEDKYSNLKKELQAQLQSLENKTDSFISNVTDKGKDKNSQLGLENKDIISAINESLSVIKSIKEAQLDNLITDELKDQSQTSRIIKPEKQGILDAKSEDLSLLKESDLKKVCEDLQKQVKKLTINLNDSTKKFKESEDYIKHLQEEYSKLEKELQVRIQMLERKTDKLIAAISDKEQAKTLQEDLGTKDTISAIHEALSEVKSMRETLSKQGASKATLSKVISTEGLVEGTGDQDFTSMPIEYPEAKVSKALITKPTEAPIIPELKKAVISEKEQLSKKDEAMEKDLVPSEATDLKKKISEATESQILESFAGPKRISKKEVTAEDAKESGEHFTEPSEVSETSAISDEQVVIAGEDREQPSEEEISESTDIPMPKSGKLVGPETEQVPGIEADDAEAKEPEEYITEPSKAPDPEKETRKSHDEQVTVAVNKVVSPETIELKDEIFVPTEVQISESERLVGLEKDKVLSKKADETELKELEEYITEPSKAPVPETETRKSHYEQVTVAENKVVLPEEELSEPSEIQIPESEKLGEPEIEQVFAKEAAEAEAKGPVEHTSTATELPATKTETHKSSDEKVAVEEYKVVPPDVKVWKEEIFKPTEVPIPKSEKPVGSEIEQAPAKKTAETEEKEPENLINEQPEAPVTETKTSICEIEKTPDKQVAVADGTEVLPRATDLTEELYKAVTEVPIPESEKPDGIETGQVPDKEIAETEEHTEPTEVPISETEMQTVLEIRKTPYEEAVGDKVVSPESIDSNEQPAEDQILETVAVEENIPTTTDLKEPTKHISEPMEAMIPKSEVPIIVPEINHITTVKEEANAKDITVTSKIKNLKEYTSEPIEAPILDSLVVPVIDEGPDSAVGDNEISFPSKETVPKEAITEPTKAPIPSEEEQVASKADYPPSQNVASEIKEVAVPEATVLKKAISKPDDEVVYKLEPTVEHEIEPVTVKSFGNADVIAQLDKTEDINIAEVNTPIPETLVTDIPTVKPIMDSSKLPILFADAPATAAETITELSPKKDALTAGIKQDPGEAVTPSSPSLATQTLQNKMRTKDHLIKAMADQLRELSRNNLWTERKVLEAAVSSSPVKTYDWDRYTLLEYLDREEPPVIIPVMKNEDSPKPNPLEVKIVRKLDKNSLLIEWGPPPSEVVGFQIFLDGQFKYWVHSVKRSKALLHPLDLRMMLEITVNPVDARGAAIHRSTVVYKP